MKHNKRTHHNTAQPHRKRHANKSAAKRAVIPVTLEPGATAKPPTRVAARKSTAVIPVALEPAGAHAGAVPKPAGQGGPAAVAVIPVAVENAAATKTTAPRARKAHARHSAKRHGSKRQHHSAARHARSKRQAKRHTTSAAVMQFQRPQSLPDTAIDMEKNTVELAGALALAAINVMETAAFIAVETPAALLGGKPSAPSRTVRRAEVLTFPAVPTAPALARSA